MKKKTKVSWRKTFSSLLNISLLQTHCIWFVQSKQKHLEKTFQRNKFNLVTLNISFMATSNDTRFFFVWQSKLLDQFYSDLMDSFKCMMILWVIIFIAFSNFHFILSYWNIPIFLLSLCNFVWLKDSKRTYMVLQQNSNSPF